VDGETQVDQQLPPYLVVRSEGGWRISTPYNRQYPAYFARSRLWEDAWLALDYLLHARGIPWRQVGWVWGKRDGQEERTSR
jgi:hypothetical protein